MVLYLLESGFATSRAPNFFIDLAVRGLATDCQVNGNEKVKTLLALFPQGKQL